MYAYYAKNRSVGVSGKRNRGNLPQKGRDAHCWMFLWSCAYHSGSGERWSAVHRYMAALLPL